MRCTQCRRIHHELPDCLVPYKRYESASIEQATTDSSESVDTAADNATLYRWKTWFCNLAPYFCGCLKSIAIRLGQDPVEDPSVCLLSAHHQTGHYVGDAPGWLARIVRCIANSNLWLHTRSAFLSATL